MFGMESWFLSLVENVSQLSLTFWFKSSWTKQFDDICNHLTRQKLFLCHQFLQYLKTEDRTRRAWGPVRTLLWHDILGTLNDEHSKMNVWAIFSICVIRRSVASNTVLNMPSSRKTEIVFYLSGFNLMVPILNKEQKAMIVAKTKKPS